MKEKRKSNKKLFFTFGAILAVTAILAAVKVIYTPVNNVSIGWVEHKQSDLWEADYAYFTGTQTSNLQGLNTKLNIDVETDEGSCNLRRAAATGAFASGHSAEHNGHLY